MKNSAANIIQLILAIFFALVIVVSVICLTGLNLDNDNWLKAGGYCLLALAVGMVGMRITLNPDCVIRHIFAFELCMYAVLFSMGVKDEITAYAYLIKHNEHSLVRAYIRGLHMYDGRGRR